jgi:peptidoglycan/xylan/chitin deacetylase (PgdA/CDA1 family)
VLNTFISLGLGVASASKLTVLTFHRVLAQPDLLHTSEPTGEQFEAWFNAWSHWFDFQPLTESVQRLRDGKLGRRTACITFDDGYMNNLDVAAPILKRLGLPATFFVATGFSDGGMMFNDKIAAVFRDFKADRLDLSSCNLGTWATDSLEARRSACSAVILKVKYFPYAQREALANEIAALAQVSVDNQPMMTRPQVQQLANMGFEIGAHTVSHPILRELSDVDAENEIRQSRAGLQALTGQKIEMFAYPNGRPGEDYDLRHVAMVKNAGFIGAVSTITGAATQTSDLYQIPRFTPWHGGSWKSGAQFLQNYRTPVRAL